MAMDLCREEGNRVLYTELLVHVNKQGVHASGKRRRDWRIGDRHVSYLGEISDRMEFSRPTRLDARGGGKWKCRTISGSILGSVNLRAGSRSVSRGN